MGAVGVGVGVGVLLTSDSAHTHSTHKAASQSDAHLRSVTIEDGTHSGFRNVVGKLTLHTVQKPQNQKSGNFLFLISIRDCPLP